MAPWRVATKKPSGSEPRFSHPVLEVGEVDQPLLRMTRKRRGVDAQPFLLVLSGYEGSDLDAGWDRRLGQLVIESTPHDQQLTLSGHPGGSSQSLGCGRVTHRPDPQRTGRFHDQPLQQLSADARSPMVGRHDELTGAPLGARLQLGVPYELVLLAHQNMSGGRMRTPQPQERRLVESPDLVRCLGISHQPQDAVNLGPAELGCHRNGQQLGHIPTLACGSTLSCLRTAAADSHIWRLAPLAEFHTRGLVHSF